MKPKHLLAPLVALSVLTALVGCTSTNRQVSTSLFDEGTLQRDATPVSSEFAQPAKKDFRALDENGDGQVNATEFLTQTPPKDSKRYHFLGDSDKTNKDYSSWDKKEFQPEGLHLFSIHF